MNLLSKSVACSVILGFILVEQGNGEDYNSGMRLSGPSGDYSDVLWVLYNKYIRVEIRDSGATGVTWSEANTMCSEEFGTELGTIRSEEDNTMVSNALSQTGWIGISSISSGTDFVWADGLGYEDEYTNWYSDAVSAYPMYSQWLKCGVMNSVNEWANAYCDSSLTSFVCNRYEVYLDTDNDGFIGVAVGLNYDSVDYDESSGICSDMIGSELASIHTNTENTIVANILTELGELHDESSRNNGFIGFSMTEDSSTGVCSISWEDGSSTDFAGDDKWTDGCTTTYGTFEDEAHGLMTTSGDWTAYPADGYGSYALVCNCDTDCQSDWIIYSATSTERIAGKDAIDNSISRTSSSQAEEETEALAASALLLSSDTRSSTSSSRSNNSGNDNTILIVCIIVGILALIGIVVGYLIYKRKMNSNNSSGQVDIQFIEKKQSKEYAPPASQEISTHGDPVDEQTCKVY